MASSDDAVGSPFGHPGATTDDSDHWFGFVESVDPFVPPRGKLGPDEWWQQVLEARAKWNLTSPNRIVWLSCIRVEYFYSLPWRQEPCEIGNPIHAERRRRELLSLDSSELTIVGWLLDRGSDRERWADVEAEGHDWLRVRLRGGGASPVVVGPDFSLVQDAQLTGLDHLGGVGDKELQALRAVFNLDFLPDADLGGDLDREPPSPIPAPDPGKASQKVDMVAVYQRLRRKWQT